MAVEVEIKSNILKRQLEKTRLENETYDLTLLLELIDSAYGHAEKERKLTDNSLQLMSSELLESNRDLRLQAEELKASQERLRKTSQQLASAARVAGMAEVATNVLHTVGNILNSINTTTTLLLENTKNSKLNNLLLLRDLLNEHRDDLETYLLHDIKGKLIPHYIMELAEHWQYRRDDMLNDMESLIKSVHHIRDCIAMQQPVAGISGLKESLNLTEIIDSILEIHLKEMNNNTIEVEKEYDDLPLILLDRVKLYQILVNLLQNAKQSLLASPQKNKILKVAIKKTSNSTIKIKVSDNGVGILAENLTKIFNHGFTTKKDGHGYGLHYCANAAAEMKGSLTAESKGADLGATFTLKLPLRITPQESS